MSEVNLLTPTSASHEISPAVKRMVKMVSLVVFGVYVVMAVGYLGWTIFNATKTKAVSAQLEQLTQQVNNLATQEVLVRRLDDRASQVLGFVDGRPKAKQAAEVLTGSVPVVLGWNVGAVGGVQTVRVGGTSSQEIWDYVGYAEEQFDNVRVESVQFTPVDGWVGVISVDKLKNEE